MSACLGFRGMRRLGCMAKGVQYFFVVMKNVLKLWWMHNSRNILKATEYTLLSDWTVLYKLYLNKALKMSKTKLTTKLLNYWALLPANWFIARSSIFPCSYNSHLKYNAWKMKITYFFVQYIFVQNIWVALHLNPSEIWGICQPACCGLPQFLPSISPVFS